MTETIFEMFSKACAVHGSKVLFELGDRGDISFDAAMEQSRRLATVLRDLGVQPGDRVAVQIDKSPEAVLLYLACLQTGGVFLPLNPAYTGAEIDYFLNDATPRVFVCQPKALHQHSVRQTGTMSTETLGTRGEGSLMTRAASVQPLPRPVTRTENDPAAILYTSGTTGRSKGAVLTHGNLASNCEALLDAWRFTHRDRLIHALPIFHTHGLFVACNMALSAGATMIFLPRFDPDHVISLMKDATVLMGVPTFYTRLLQSPRLTPASTASMRLFVSGSAPLSTRDHTTFSERTGHAILERYGMTETGMITSNPYDGERRPGAVGMPLPGIEIRISARDRGGRLPDGEIGAIEVRGPNVFQCYWHMPEKTASEFRSDGFFVTGDLGLVDADGYLRIVGRDKDLVISGGYNVYPKEVETLLDAQPGVEETAVIGVPHPDLGEGVTAIVVAKPGAARDERSLLAGLSGRIARYKQPKRAVFVEELPRNVMGKVQKAELRSRYSNLYQHDDTTAGEKA